MNWSVTGWLNGVVRYKTQQYNLSLVNGHLHQKDSFPCFVLLPHFKIKTVAGGKNHLFSLVFNRLKLLVLDFIKRSSCCFSNVWQEQHDPDSYDGYKIKEIRMDKLQQATIVVEWLCLWKADFGTAKPPFGGPTLLQLW